MKFRRKHLKKSEAMIEMKREVYEKMILGYMIEAIIEFREKREEGLIEEMKESLKKMLGISSPWDVVMRVIDSEVFRGNGKLIRGMDNRVYGITCMGQVLAFQRTSNDGYEEIREEYSIPEIEVAFGEMKKEINCLTKCLLN